MLMVWRALLDGTEPGPPPSANGAIVPEVRVDGDARAPGLMYEILSHRSRAVRAKTTTACARNDEHVDPALIGCTEPGLDVADRLTSRFNHVGVHVRAVETPKHLFAREGLAIPELGDIRIGMPPDKQVGVRRCRRTDDGQLTVERSRRRTNLRAQGSESIAWASVRQCPLSA